jgi:imidazolonepropionase-like amidohydrolase
MKTIHYIGLSLAMMISHLAWSQVPRPSFPQEEPIAVMNGRIHVGNGQIIENGIITFRDGKLEQVVDATTVRLDLNGYKVISAEGKQIYPGLIATNVTIGLAEIDAVRSTRDNSEVGDYNPHVRSIIAYNAETELVPTLRFNGITHAQIVPQGGRITGSSSVVNFDAWNWEDAVVKYDEGIHLNWMSLFSRPRWWMGETEWRENPNYVNQYRELETFFNEAKAYAKMDKPNPKNLYLEAMKGVLNGEQTLYISANRAKEIVESVQFAQRMGVKKIVLVEAADAYYVRDFIKKNNIPVILNGTHNLPNKAEEDIDMPYKLPGLLQKEGIKVIIGYWDSNMKTRNLPFVVGTAVNYGLDRNEALKMVTQYPAEVLGVADKMGTLESGKSASFVVSDGDIFEMSGNVLRYVFIDGKEVNLHAKQQELYERYKAKYERSKKQ